VQDMLVSNAGGTPDSLVRTLDELCELGATLAPFCDALRTINGSSGTGMG